MTNIRKQILVVADTNVFINALFGNGMFRNDMRIMDLEEQGKIKFAFSDMTRNELILICARKITELGHFHAVEFTDLLYDIFNRSTTIEEVDRLETLSSDKSDQIFIETAVHLKADYLVTNDMSNGLLELGQYKNVTILKPDTFLRRIRKQVI